MASILPMKLTGHLGQRHKYLNLQVIKTVTEQASFQDVESLPEETAVDRLFKIDLANKLKNVNYILKQLKDNDMLYVSRALKCKWLLERRDIINPKHLEDTLFPEMVLPAISKMRHWLYINLKDPSRCQEFYQYYKSTKFEFALKFLCNCDDEFVLKEFLELLHKITPHYLKIFAEKNPKLVKIYFDSLATDVEFVKHYLKKEKDFYNCIKYILKSDPNLFLDILEKYHNINRFPKFSPSATKYILRYHKNRFMAKLELYVVHLLHMPTAVQCLSIEECQEVVIRLARADYLSQWFSYENVEPLIKRVEGIHRAEFKKRVFVEKNVGEHVVKCPYNFPASPKIPTIESDTHVFHDREYSPIRLSYMRPYKYRRTGSSLMLEDCVMMCSRQYPVKSDLQILFDEFRFVNFEGTFQELKERLGATSSADRRRDILLVLVSKSGGRFENLRTLLQLALRLRNEPVHQRATIVRSLVKRACAWRMPDDVWNMMLEYGVGLGLDGSKAEAQCREGLHAVVLRQLLAAGDCDPLVRTAFLDDFSTLSEYKLTAIEREAIGVGVHNLILNVATDAEPEKAAIYLRRLLEVLKDYHMNVGSPVVSAVTELAKRDLNSARPLLKRLYYDRVGRRELLREYLNIKHDDAALVNILRHDLQALETDWFIELLCNNATRANQFLLKLTVYFNETGGIAEKIRLAIEDTIIKEPNISLARPLATLMKGGHILTLLCEQNKADGERHKFTAALRSNLHRSRPAPDALALGWRQAGMKAFAGRAMCCRPAQVTTVIQSLLEESDKRTIRLTLALAQRTDCVVDVFEKAAVIRPLAALRAALLYFRSRGAASDPQIWDIVKSFLFDVDLRPREGLRYIVRKVKWVPEVLRPNYCAVLYLALEKIDDDGVDDVLSSLMKYLPKVNDDLFNKVLLRMLENLGKDNPESYPALVIRYLMLSHNIQEVNIKFDIIGEQFLEKIYMFRNEEDQLRRCFFQNNFDQILKSLQYNFVFFDEKYQCCLTVIERVLKWMETFLPKDMYFKQYVKIHGTMLYFKAIRQSMKHKPEIFADVARKMSEGVDVVGFTFGRYLVREVAELRTKYFDSIIEIYSKAITDYFNGYFEYSQSNAKFMGEIIKGMLAESTGTEARIAVQVLRKQSNYLNEDVFEAIKELVSKQEDMAVQFFWHV